MGRALKTKGPSPAQAAQVDALQAEIERLECDRVALLAVGLPTVKAQIDHLAILVAIHSHLQSVARLRGDVREVVSITGAIAKLNDDMRGLQKNAIDDKLDELLRRADHRDESRRILARYAE
jgi:hypothetical protein